MFSRTVSGAASVRRLAAPKANLNTYSTTSRGVSRLVQRRAYSATAAAVKADPQDAPATKLSNHNLHTIRSQAYERPVPATPAFDRAGVKEGIVHIGIGGFHRAHLAVYVDSLMGEHGVRDWAICGVGLQPFDAAMRDALVPQDCLYTVIERSAQGSDARVIGAINSFLFAPDGPEKVIDKMAHPDTKIVSMTITETGYYYNENTHQLQIEHPDIVADLASDLKSPKTTFGFLYAALAKRYEAGLKPFTVLSCDNMQKNGTITANMLLTFARHRDPKVAGWIEKNGAFPNSMVDRITPRTADADKIDLTAKFGVEDSWPVVTEPFKQWVLEDKFANGRPAFEKVGAQVVPRVSDVEKFECHKLRLLNASHTAMSYTAFLGGFEYVHQVIENPTFNRYLYNMMQQEVKPLLPEIPGVSIDAYCNKLMERFANPTIMDQINRLTLNGSGKLPQFIMPSVAEQIMARTHNFKRLVFCVASWFRYLHGVDEHGRTYNIDDPMAKELQALAIEGGDKPYPLLNVKNLFGDDLREDKIFVDELTKALKSIHRDGAVAALANYVD